MDTEAPSPDNEALDAEARAGQQYCAELAGEHLVKLCDQLGEELVNAHRAHRETDGLLDMLGRVWELRWQLGIHQGAIQFEPGER